MLNVVAVEDHTKDNHVAIWKDFLRIIKDNVNELTYNTWFLPIKPVSIEGSLFKIQLPSEFFWEWIEEHFNTIINKAIKEVLGPSGKLVFIIKEEPVEPVTFTFKSENKVSQVSNNIQVKDPEFESGLNTKYTFDNFIKGEGNQLAYAAAKAISENPGTNAFNPFFIYGGSGLGKTHLLQAIGNKVTKDLPGKKVFYTSSDTFSVAFVDAIQANKRYEFSFFYSKMDVLIIDDIQFLVGKDKTQDQIFHVFNALHQNNKQLIFSSDKPPKDLKGLDDRLISRFQWGLTADIQPPDLETRIAILKRKSIDYGMDIEYHIIEYIAKNVTSNIRELEGCLIKLLANVSFKPGDISIDLIKNVVQEIATDRKVNITIENITKNVCSYLDIDENKLRDKTRKKEIVFARQLTMYLCKKLTKSSLKSIGLHFGGRDHSTVIHACTSIEDQISIDSKVKELVEVLEKQIEISSI